MNQNHTQHITISADFCERLFALLEQNTIWLEELGQLLELEHKVLGERNFLSLPTIHAKKSLLIKSLYRSKHQCGELQGKAGISSPKPLSFIEGIIPSAYSQRLGKLRQRIITLTQHNALINSNIAKQLHRSQASIQTVMDTLQGRQASSTVYSANGKTNALRSDSLLAQA